MFAFTENHYDHFFRYLFTVIRCFHIQIVKYLIEIGSFSLIIGFDRVFHNGESLRRSFNTTVFQLKSQHRMNVFPEEFEVQRANGHTIVIHISIQAREHD